MVGSLAFLHHFHHEYPLDRSLLILHGESSVSQDRKDYLSKLNFGQTMFPSINVDMAYN